MYDKYGIKTYPENYIQEDPESDSENELSNLPFKKATYFNENQNLYPNEIITPSLMSKVNNNIAYYQQSHRNNKIITKNPKLIEHSLPSFYDSDIINSNHLSSSNKKTNKLQYKKNNFKNNHFLKYSNNPKANLNKYFNMTETREEIFLEKKLKTYTNQYLDVEKKDNFKVLSYKPEDYNTDNNKINNKSKIIQIFKKQEGSKLFFPSKRAKSPPSNPSSNNNSANKKDQDKQNNTYKAPTLKFQSFFGSFMRPNINKCSKEAKSTSKNRVNQLEDFNIEKLIEIGDKTNNKLNNILSFGQKIKNLRNQIKIKRQLQTEEFMRYKVRTENNIEDDFDEQVEPKPIKRIELKKKGNLIMNKPSINDKIKKKVAHIQIKRKKNIQQNQTFNNPSNQTDNIQANNSNMVNKSEKLNKSNIIIRSRRINNSTNNNNNLSYQTNGNNSTKRYKLTKINTTTYPRNEFLNQSQNTTSNGNGRSTSNYINRRIIQKSANNKGIIKKISPIKTVNNKRIYVDKTNPPNSTDQSKKINTNTESTANNNKFHYSVKNFSNNENHLERNKYMNYSLMNTNKSVKKESPKKNILEEIKEVDYNESNTNEAIEENKIDMKKGVITDDEKLRNKKNIINGGINETKKSYVKDYKNKRYYGYDDRHNLEGTINNHTVYYSNYTKKKDKIN